MVFIIVYVLLYYLTVLCLKNTLVRKWVTAKNYTIRQMELRQCTSSFQVFFHKLLKSRKSFINFR